MIFDLQKPVRYYIDVENTGRLWLDLVPKLGPDDTIMLYTSKHTSVTYGDLIPVLPLIRDGRIDIREGFVRGVGDSALDYFLMGEVSNDVRRDRDLQAVIYSNDGGYDDFVDEMSRSGFSVSRKGFPAGPKIATMPAPASVKIVDRISSAVASPSKFVPVSARKSNVDKIQTALQECIRTHQGKANYLSVFNCRKLAEAFVSGNGDFSVMLSTVKDSHMRLVLGSLIPGSVRTNLKNML